MSASSSSSDAGGADHAAAAAVKAGLLEQFSGDLRLRGIGLARTATGGFRVEVRVAEEQHIAELALPATIDGVPVQVRAIGDVTAPPASQATRERGADR